MKLCSDFTESLGEIVKLELLVFDNEISRSELFIQFLYFLIESLTLLLIAKFKTVDLDGS